MSVQKTAKNLDFSLDNTFLEVKKTTISKVLLTLKNFFEMNASI